MQQVNQSSADRAGVSVTQTLRSGQRLGPYPVCFTVQGPATAPLTLVWIDAEALSFVEAKLRTARLAWADAL